MKDIPVFTTENGAASLILREIPYRKTAYVKVHASLDLPSLLEDCIALCRAAGADRIYASGHSELDQYPFHTAVWKMARPLHGITDTEAALWPVQEHTLEQWRKIYNEKMAFVDNSSWLSITLAQEMLQKGDGYFVHKNGTLLGIGRASHNRLDAVVSVEKGAGAEVVAALCHALFSEDIVLEVASTNHRAIRLYERMGFTVVAELSRWHKIFLGCQGKVLDKPF